METPRVVIRKAARRAHARPRFTAGGKALAEHIYEQPRTYTVTDDDGARRSRKAQVVVRDGAGPAIEDDGSEGPPKASATPAVSQAHVTPT